LAGELAVAELTKESIANLREELTKDLEALARVEKLLSGKNGLSSIESGTNTQVRKSLIPPPPLPPQSDNPPHETFEGLGLKRLVIAGLKLVSVGGAAPRDLVAFCKDKGYVFTSDANASASITTALARLIVDGKVRRDNGRYYWIEG
jgi:hypothetical protein